MPNMKRYYEDGLAYFVTTVTHRRRPLFEDRRMCRLILITMAYYKMVFDYEVYGYCIMPDHLHAIIRPNSKYNLSFLMKMIKGSFARKINRLSDLEEPTSVWQAGFYEQGIRNNAQLLTQINYIHDNPLKANLASSGQDYEFSSFRQYHFPESQGEPILQVDKPQ